MRRTLQLARARFGQFLRSAATGGAATVTDLAVIAIATFVLHLDPRVANVPALLAGALVQFLGNRHYAFKSASGSLKRQLVLFAITEAVALTLNAVLYHAVATAFVLTPAAAVLARALTTNLVYLLWSYPVWKRVFRPSPQPMSVGS